MTEEIKIGNTYFMNTYNRYPLVIEKGEGMYLFDSEGKEYLDFASGIGVFALGYKDEKYNDALKQQIDKILHISNYYYSEPAVKAAEKICQVSGMEKVFFTNSGAEAVEGALKIAKKYARQKGKGDFHEIIAMEHSFHGRSIGALSVTGTSKYREPFSPLLPSIRFAQFNNLQSVKELINDNTCAIIMEPVQGEGGIHPAEEKFIKGIKEICDEQDILLIFDEVQCGMGRTGSMFAYEEYGVLPDVLTLGKALGCGVPVGAFLTGVKASNILVPGDHGTTYGGNPFVTAAVLIVLDLFSHYDILRNVKKQEAYLKSCFEKLQNKHSNIKECRGKGLMWGVEFYAPVNEIIVKAQEKGLILIGAGPNVLRFLPPLIVKEKEIDKMIRILEEIIE